MPTWAQLAIMAVEPVSRITVSTSSARWASNHSAMPRSTATRSSTGVVAQAPASKVRWAAPMAASNWARSPSGTSVKTSSVAGSSTPKVTVPGTKVPARKLPSNWKTSLTSIPVVGVAVASSPGAWCDARRKLSPHMLISQQV